MDDDSKEMVQALVHNNDASMVVDMLVVEQDNNGDDDVHASAGYVRHGAPLPDGEATGYARHVDDD